MKRIIAGLAALAAAGCAGWGDNIGPSTPDSRQRVENQRQYCEKEVNSDDYLACRGQNSPAADGVGASVTWPGKKPKEPKVPVAQQFAAR